MAQSGDATAAEHVKFYGMIIADYEGQQSTDDGGLAKGSLAVAQASTPPMTTELAQNYPNPFNPETIIDYQVPENGLGELYIYNVLGQKVRTLVNDVKSAGTYQVLWDGRDDAGNRLATGMYIYQLRGKNAMITKRMIMVK